ncbi:MAG: hypothetical protein GTO51_01675 [Candidatus Latescibacteria bacterium]|nr:hypothetical protein [Candidatus Latescibacterota bacterium]NIM22136.1 hypothetical protein [Candidatus Latescibacterota bacterium]NIM64686.1 hypothetical protein [Candidatus Latescibacterota bacterium]NIO01196.1 hypothetical protein [Candidatus Latescibacterota bacterium]NIO27581.1 hypothetical protein [Candidatus Latescibacterota bacterium]
MATKRRRIRFHRRLSLVLALALSIVLTFWIFKRSAYLPYQVSKFVNEHYLKGTPFRFSCKKVSGDFVNRVSLEHPHLRYDDGRKRFTIFEADDVTVNYQLMQLLKLRLIVDELTIDNARIQVGQDESGRLVIPLSPSNGGPGESMSPQVDVRRFAINGLHLFFSGGARKLMVRDVFLSGSLQYADQKGSLEVEDGSGYLIDTETSISSLRTRVEFQGQDLNLKGFVTRLDKSFIMATGGYQDGKLEHLQLVFNPVDLKEISDMGLLPSNEGELGGSVVLDGPLDSLTLNGRITGSGWGLIFGGLSFSGVMAGNELYMSSLEGDIFGSHINGQARYIMGDDGGFEFKGFCSDLDLSQGFLPVSGAPETGLYGDVEIEHSRPAGSYVFRADLDSSVVNGFESDRLVMNGRWLEEQGLEIDEVRLMRPGFIITGSGTVDTQSQADLLFGLKGDDITYLWEFLSLPPIEGRLDLNGRISGPIDKLQINLNGEFQEASYLFAAIDSGTVQAQINDVPSESVSVRVDLRGREIALQGREFSNPHVLLEAMPDIMMVKDFSFAKGDTFITMDFDVRGDSLESLLTFKHISLTTEDDEWKTAAPFDLLLEQGSVRIDSLVLYSRRGSVGVVGNYSVDAGRCRLSGWGESIDFSMFQDAFALPFRLQGRSRFRAAISGDVDNPDVELFVSLREGAIDSLSFDRLEFEGAFSPQEGYQFDRLVVVAGGDSLVASGWWRLPMSPVLLAREGIEVEESTTRQFALELESHHFPLSTALQALHSGVRPSGAFTGGILFESIPSAPRVRITGTLSDAKKGGVHLPAVACEFVYEDSILSVMKVAFDDGTWRGELKGSLPMVLSIPGGVRLRQDIPLSLEGSIESEDLVGLQQYFDRVASTSGKLSGDVEIGGSFEVPVMTGEIDVTDGTLRLSGMEEVYRDIDAKVAFEEDQIRIMKLTGKEGKRGSFYGSGFAKLHGFTIEHYQVDLHFKDFLLASIPDVSSTQDGLITITSQQWGDEGLIPNITGSATVKQAQIMRALGAGEGPASAITMPTASPDWICSIDISAPKNVWVRNPDLNMEIAGEVILKRDDKGLYLRGELEILRGRYTIYNNKFRITDGRFDFSKAVALRPEIFLEAYTPYRREGDREHRIFLNLSWPYDKKEPQLTLSYDEPGYSETDIWKMLGGTYVSPTAGSGSGTWDATGTAHGIASNYLERILNAQMSDVTIDVEAGTPGGRRYAADGEREMTIAIGKYLSEDLYLKYRQGISVRSEREVDIEYRISNMLLIRSEIIRHSERLFLGQRRRATDEINLDIKFRFEY